MSTLRKNVFSGPSVKFVFFYGSINTDSVVFGSAAFWEIEGHRHRATSFQKKKFYGSFGFVSILRKKVFLGAPVKCFSLYGSNNSDSVAFGKPVLQRSKITVSERQLFKETFAMKVLGMGLSCLKRYLQEHQWSAFFFMAQMTQILLFSGMSVSQRSKITVWVQQIF